MADASQELMLRVRGDNSGADKAMAQTTRALKGLSLSGQRAGGVFREFSRTLADAKSGADVAAGAADGLSRIIGRSLAGAVAVGAVKIFTDQIERMAASVKESATSAAKAFNDIENAGAAMSLAEAQSQVKGLEGNISSLQTKLDELDRSPFQNFIAKTTGARKELEALQTTQQRLRDAELAAGLMSQNINEIKLASLDEEGKALEKINQEYRDRDKVAATMTDKSAQAQYQSESADKFARDRNALIDKQAKAQRDKQEAYNDEVFRAEIEANIYARKFKENADKEAAERQKADQESAHKEELYNIEEAAKLQESVDKTKFDRMMRDARFALSEQKRLIEKKKSDFESQSKLSGGLLGASKDGQQFLDVARKTRGRENKQADFKAQEAVFGNLADAENKRRAAQGITTMTTPSEMKKRVAAQQAASEAPSLADQIQGQMTGVDPSQIASEQVKSRFEKQGIGMASVGPKNGTLGTQEQTQTKEVMTAIQSLVDLMKSATLVN